MGEGLHQPTQETKGHRDTLCYQLLWFVSQTPTETVKVCKNLQSHQYKPEAIAWATAPKINPTSSPRTGAPAAPQANQDQGCSASGRREVGETPTLRWLEPLVPKEAPCLLADAPKALRAWSFSHLFFALLHLCGLQLGVGVCPIRKRLFTLHQCRRNPHLYTQCARQHLPEVPFGTCNCCLPTPGSHPV